MLIIRIMQMGAAIFASILKYNILVYKTAPAIQAVAYISLAKIKGISFNKVSLITPPNTADIKPKITAANGLTPNSKLF